MTPVCKGGCWISGTQPCEVVSECLATERLCKCLQSNSPSSESASQQISMLRNSLCWIQHKSHTAECKGKQILSLYLSPDRCLIYCLQHIQVDLAPVRIFSLSFLKFFNKFIYYFWLHRVFVAVCRLSLFAASGGLLFIVVHGLLIAVASLVVEHGL